MLAVTDTLRNAMQNIQGVQSVCLVEVGEGQLIGLACHDTEENSS